MKSNRSRRLRTSIAGALIVPALAASAWVSTGAAHAQAGATRSSHAQGGKHFDWIGFENNDDLQPSIACGAERAASQAGDTMTYKAIGTEFTAADQIPVLQAAAATKPAGIVVTPVDKTALVSPIESVVARGIPVVTGDQELANSAKLSGVVTLYNRQAGVLAADYLAKRAAGRKVQVAVVSFEQGASTAADGEVYGFVHELKKYPNIENVAAKYGADIDTSTYVSIMSALLAQYPHLYAVFGTFAQDDDGLLSAIAEHHLKTVVVAGYGSHDPRSIQALKTGAVGAIVDFDWYQFGMTTTQTLIKAVDTGKTQPTQTLPASVFTRSDISKLSAKVGPC